MFYTAANSANLAHSNFLNCRQQNPNKVPTNINSYCPAMSANLGRPTSLLVSLWNKYGPHFLILTPKQ
jgi:hypothetical protein